MAQTITKFIANDAVTSAKIPADAVTGSEIRLANDEYLKARNAANNANIDVFKVNASDRVELDSLPQCSDVPSANEDLTNKAYVDSVAGVADWEKETQVLDGTDITNQYIDLGFEAAVDSITLMVKGAGAVLEGASYDYSVSYTGGSGGVTRITFLNDLATAGASALVATDVLQIQYQKA